MNNSSPAVPSALCPFCKAAVSGEELACPVCAIPFPWSKQRDLLLEQIKERETNRVRATYTLVEELVQSGRTGKPVSLAALKGFLASWLFPRTVIVIGSLAATFFLFAQTYILYNQTQLLGIQAAAAQIDQESKLRDAAVSTARLKQLWEQVTKDVISDPSMLCEQACRATKVAEMYRADRDSIGRSDYFRLQRVSIRDSVSRSLRSAGLPDDAPLLALARNVVTSSQQCARDPQWVAAANAAFVQLDDVLTLIDSPPHPPVSPAPPATLREAAQFAQTLTFRLAPFNPRFVAPGEMTIGDTIEAIGRLQQKLKQHATELAATCSQALTENERALKRLTGR